MKINPQTGRPERAPAEKARHQRLREALQFDTPPTSAQVIARFDEVSKHEALRKQLHQLIQSLRAERERRGVPLEHLAQSTGWDKTQLARIEDNEESVTSFDMLVRWAEALGKKVQLELVDAA